MNYTAPLVKKILENPDGFDWSIQGLGMLRLYLSPDIRLHVWDSSAKYEDVSTMHTHPWDFISYVVFGEVRQYRFTEATGRSGVPFNRQEILCGEGGGPSGDPEIVYLQHGREEVHPAGSTYRQEASEIHSSFPADGTVTIIHRTFHEDTDHAFVYYPQGEEWVTAEPRPATFDEVHHICASALSRYEEGAVA